MKSMRLKSVLIFLIIALPQIVHADLISIGVLSQRNSDEYQSFWKKTAKNLSQKIPEHTFVIKSLGLECLTHSISKHQLDFAITNPAHFVLLEKSYDAFPIATLQSRYRQNSFSHFSAAIITRSKRDDIQSLADLKGQHFMASSPNEFGGYQMVWRQLLDAGINPQNDFFELFFSNDSDVNIVKSILHNEADVAAIQSGVLEHLIDSGELQPGQIKVLNSDPHQSMFPSHSTIQYPEWSFIGLEQTDIALAKEVARVLISMPKPDSKVDFIPAYGWTEAQDLTTVHGLLRALKLPPYSPMDKVSLKAIIHEHGMAVGLINALILILMIFSVRMRQVNRKLAVSQSELANHRDNLEKEVQQRTAELIQLNSMLEEDIKARQKVENTLRRSQNALQGFYQILVNPSSGYLDKLHQLMALAKKHFKMEAVFLYQIESEEAETLNNQTLTITAFEGDYQLHTQIRQCLQENYLSSDIQSYKNPACDKRMLSLPVNVNGKLHSILTLVGQIRKEQELADVDKELLRLITQWIRSGIERHEIEEDRERYRLQLGKVARLYTMGEMASGLAHEINQPLTAATNFISGSLRRLKEDASNPEVENGLNRSLLCLNQTTSIIRRLREFVQTGVPRDETFDFIILVGRVLDLLATEARQNGIVLITPSQNQTVLVKGDRVQLEQVMLNLVRNAIDACEAKGQVSIATEIEVDYLTVKVRDTGQGIEPEDMSKIFDAFHTSKPFGMGLGLAICRSIIEAHGSSLQVKNTEHGAEFSFRLPLATSPHLNSKE